MARPSGSKNKKKTTDEIIEQTENELKNPQPKKEKKLEFISTGSTMLNLALSGIVDGGWVLGDMANLIGPSNIGKTLMGLTMFAECVNDKKFNKHYLEYQAVEKGLYFPIETMFGSKMDRMNIFSKSPYTIQDWQSDMMKKTKKSYIGVLDSLDAITTKDDLEAAEKGKIEKGGYRTEKPLVLSAVLSPIVGQIEENNGFLMIVSHGKKSIIPYTPPWRRSGGDSAGFFSSQVVWLSKIEDIKKKIRGKDEIIGERVRAKVGRTRLVGAGRTVEFPVYKDYGIDDVESMVDFLIDRNFWGYKTVKEEDKKIQFIDTEDDFPETKIPNVYDFARYIEGNNLEDKLKKIVQECWNILEEELSPVKDRKKKYQ